ncbi:type II toxin-antitoxin system RelE/ParE family toxin [Herbaspirillum robiniae]|uniref:Type II toxin-antitoxin system RelE/ParE family toxin n=1 Tax=Herbaspirillum robiniae TaxID=2014887 RepID=A0ABX2M044_9BURK|nr:type II toxin-antitoxin system RelE/ParE family toxin [Herbaspirillum robiniae]NUU00971.1 type II toxin-antitoxin system RelE/ParE family toxin [Herbaspirillum robiniae]
MPRLSPPRVENEGICRVFKSRWFAREVRRSQIPDSELRAAVGQLIKGQGEDLGGGVWKKRLHRNADRAIVLARSGGHFFFVFLFAKSDRSNIRRDELQAFRRLSDAYAKLDRHRLDLLVEQGVLLEISDG